MKKIIISLLALMFSWGMEASESKYEFSDWSGLALPVFIAKPPKINKSTRLVLVMHGRKRNAEEYRDQWIGAARDLNLLVIVPEFSEINFPEVWGYNYGNVKTKEFNSIQKEHHSFSAIEPLARDALKRFKLDSSHWGIYGHGAGAHFVHRFVLYNPNASYTLAIAANLGWYLSMTDQEWPFGLTNSGINTEQLKESFGRYFLLMLGRADTSTKPNTPYVAKNFDAIKQQGKHRLDRGRNFFKSAVQKSKSIGQFFKWGMVEVPTTKGHSNTEQMVPYAAEMFYARLK